MMQVLGLTAAVFIAIGASGGSAVQSSVPTNYEVAIAEAQAPEKSDGRPWLRSCVRQWASHDAQRGALLDEFNGRPADEMGILLEVGNSAFQKYEFISILGDTFKTDKGDEPVEKSVLSRLETLLEKNIASIHGEAAIEKFDGNCFFLTMRLEGERKQIAIYGSTHQPAAEELIRELLELRGRK